jgi:2,3-bisphosphoglycerate-dependent phosphoglycerate mutase
MSSLVRAQMTAQLAMTLHSSKKIPVVIHQGEGKLQEWSEIYSPEAQETTIPAYVAWQLNERMYGKLQGLNKQKTIEKYGAEQVKLWRRSYDTPPPEGESLKMTTERTIPYFQENILPRLKQGENVFVCAHGNSLRAIVMFLDNLSKEEVLELEIATGVPLIYDL